LEFDHFSKVIDAEQSWFTALKSKTDFFSWLGYNLVANKGF